MAMAVDEVDEVCNMAMAVDEVCNMAMAVLFILPVKHARFNRKS